MYQNLGDSVPVIVAFSDFQVVQSILKIGLSKNLEAVLIESLHLLFVNVSVSVIFC